MANFCTYFKIIITIIIWFVCVLALFSSTINLTWTNLVCTFHHIATKMFNGKVLYCEAIQNLVCSSTAVNISCLQEKKNEEASQKSKINISKGYQYF